MMKKLFYASFAALLLLLAGCGSRNAGNPKSENTEEQTKAVSKYTKVQLLGQWTETMMHDEMILNEDGTGQKGNTAILGLRPIKWELDGDSLRIIAEKETEAFLIDSIPEADYQGYHVYGLFLSKTNSDGKMSQRTWVRKERQQ